MDNLTTSYLADKIDGELIGEDAPSKAYSTF